MSAKGWNGKKKSHKGNKDFPRCPLCNTSVDTKGAYPRCKNHGILHKIKV